MDDESITNAIATGAPIVVLSGPHASGGARRWVEAHKEEFSNRYLTVDFNQYRVRQGVLLSEILRQCLLALDVRNPPMTFTERCMRYRRCVEQQGRTAIGLDNADQAAQVRPFGVPGSVVIVSSVRLLGGLVTEKAHFLHGWTEP